MASFAGPYSGYTASPPGSSPSFKAAMTAGEHPTVFSLKSRRNLPARPPVGGEYGAMATTAGRGLTAPLGSFGGLGFTGAAPPPIGHAPPALPPAPAWRWPAPAWP